VISTPRSGWFDCVGERGTGTAVFLELARWAVDRFPDHSIHLVNAGAHEYYFAGSHK
jgi:Zn-dependent M28 family amino/carboxypeptidase